MGTHLFIPTKSTSTNLSNFEMNLLRGQGLQSSQHAMPNSIYVSSPPTMHYKHQYKLNKGISHTAGTF